MGKFVLAFLLPLIPLVGGVRTLVGDIVGSTTDVNIDGQLSQVRTFYGIPYAESPSGQRRFQKPVPKTFLTSPFNATGNIISCAQIEYNLFPGDDKLVYSEDCLTLNIYAPPETPSQTFPVMLFIYGGGFNTGTSAQYDGARLSAYGDVIVVTINYRLAVYGFLSTGEASAPGNNGLWDQHLAIKWVHDNIEAFGGDKERITIFGESAGSASVIYQALFSGNKGLFKRAIAESGSASAPWAYTLEPADSARKLSEALGCLQTTWREKIVCLRSKSELELTSAVSSAAMMQSAAWLPVVDGDFVKERPSVIFESDQSDLRAKALFNDIDLLIGINNMEGVIFIGDLMATFNIYDPERLTEVTRKQFGDYTQGFIKNTLGYGSEVQEPVSAATIFEYTHWSDLSSGLKRLESLFDIVADTLFSAPAVKTANAHAAKTTDRRTYFYRFSIRPPIHLLPPFPSDLDGPDKAGHGDELPFVFGSFEPGEATAMHLESSKAVMTMWTNFAKSGDPNEPGDIVKYIGTTWPRYDTTSQSYLDITPTLGPSSVKQRVWAKRMNLWLSLVPAIIETAQNKTFCSAN